MDINILLALQAFRNGPGSAFGQFLSKMTFLGEMNTILILIAVVYWCVSREFGTYFLLGWSGNSLVNGFLKITACAYRPWIRDARVIPDSAAQVTATGYSFPSGHSMNAASVYGGAAVRKDLPKAARIAFALVVVFVAFSRNYLGVHTPQDVLVGALAGTLVMVLAGRLLKWLEKHPEKDIVVMWIGVALAAAIAVYAGVKPYPEDFDAEGKLLVDGAKMAKDTFKGVGWCVAFLVGWILEKRYIRFSTDITLMERVTRLVVGLFGYYITSLIFGSILKGILPSNAGAVASCFLQVFYITFLFPWCLRYLEKGRETVKQRIL